MIKKFWKKYLNANPIFDHKAKKGSYKLNTTRKTYQEYFYGDTVGQTPSSEGDSD